MNAHLKINFIIEYFYPEIGGLEKSTERLALELIKKGHKVNVITNRSIQSSPEYENFKGIKIFRYSNNYLQEAKKLYYKADINCVFGVGHALHSNVWGDVFKAQKATFIKIGTSGDMLKFGEHKSVFNKFDAILCQNDELCAEALSIGVLPEKIFKIKNGLDIQQWDKRCVSKEFARKKLGIAANAVVVSAVGRFVKRKNFPLILDGCYEYVKKHNYGNFVLVIHGGAEGQHDSDEITIKQQILKYSKYFKIVRQTPEDSVHVTLSASDLFITMGEREGAPNIIIEALPCSLPVVASAISGHDVYVGPDNGILVQFDANSIACALSRILGDMELRKNFATKSREHSKKFDIFVTSDLYLEAFYKYKKIKESK